MALHRPALNPHLPRARLQRAEDDVCELGSAGAYESGEPEDLAAAHRERYVLEHVSERDVSELRNDLAGICGSALRALVWSSRGAADDQFRERTGVCDLVSREGADKRS